MNYKVLVNFKIPGNAAQFELAEVIHGRLVQEQVHQEAHDRRGGAGQEAGRHPTVQVHSEIEGN